MSVQADMAVDQSGTAIDHTDILNVLRDNYRISEAANDSESTTMIRLNELHIKAVSAIQQQYLGRQRRILTSISLALIVVTH
jgi:hypothetical protein